MWKPVSLRDVARSLTVAVENTASTFATSLQSRGARKNATQQGRAPHSCGDQAKSHRLGFLALAVAGFTSLSNIAPAHADSFYFSRMRSPADAQEGGTGLFVWNDATGGQSQVGGDGTFLRHATDGGIPVDGIATNLSGTLYGFAIDDSSTAGYLPLDIETSMCVSRMRSRLVSINTSTGVISYVGSWLSGRDIRAAGFDGLGRLWAADCVSNQILEISPASGGIIRSIPAGTSGSMLAHADIDFASSGLGIIALSTLQFRVFDPAAGWVASTSINALSSGFDSTLSPPYIVSGASFTRNLSARSGNAAASTCRLNLVEARGTDELGHVNDPFSANPTVAFREVNQYDPPNRAAGFYNGGTEDMARAGGPALPDCFFDWGDAPASYGTQRANNGAYHAIVAGGPFLGSGLPDFEIDGQPDASALGDDTGGTNDENGVVVPELVRGATAQIEVNVGNAGPNTRLQAWIDWAGDGSFSETGDQILIDVVVAPGVNTFDVPVPATAVSGSTFARFRVADEAGLAFAGPAFSGEVEDYQIEISGDQPTFGVCTSTMFLAQNRPTSLYRFDTSSNPITVQPIGSASSFTYNAVAYNPSDNYLYAISSTNSLLRIGGDGSATDLGTVTNLPQVAGQEYNAAEIGPDGSFYVRTNAVYNGLYRVDIASRTATAIPLSQTLSVADLAWHNGLLYTVDNQNFTLTLYAINPASGQVTPIGPTGLASSGFGALFGASNGVYGGLNAGGFYQFNLTTGAATLISDLPGSGNNDGAKCALSPMEFGADLSITKDDGATTYTPGLDASYTIVVTNDGPFGVQGARISDPLPSGITTASWTCGNATGGAQCGVASGTGAIDTTADLPAGSSVTYTLSMGIPTEQTGSLTNTATVTPPDGTSDPDTSNNTASDTNTAAPPPTSGVCSPVRVLGNTTFNGTPLPISGSVQKSGAPNGWNATSPWSTLGGNYTFRWTFSQPVPANWIQFIVSDVGATSYQSTPARFTISLGAGSTANLSDFSFVPGWHPTFTNLNYSGGVLSYNPSGDVKQAGALQGNSADTVTSITITTSNVDNADYIVNLLYVRPACLTLQKVSEEGTGSFNFNMSNVMQANGTAVPSTALTTTTAGTAVSSPAYNSIPGTELVLSEVVPAGWNASGAVCTDQNAGNTGNPTVIGSFATPTLTIPAANVRPQSAIQCLFTNEIANPALTTDKTGTLNDLDGDGLIDAGETITYSFLVTNTGGVTLTDVTPNDPLLTNAGISVTPGPQTLAPGGTATFTATYTPTQAEIDAGRVENTATSTGTPPSGPPIESPPDTVTVPPDQGTGLRTEKTGVLNDLDGDDLLDAGETITYSFVVTNTGAVTLTDVTPNDPLLTNAGISVTPGPQTLAPGGSATFTATYTPTQAEIDAGEVVNTATSTGTPPSGPPIESPPDTVNVPPDQTPGLRTDKTGRLNDLDGDGLIDIGETITYSFVVTNTGGVTLTDVSPNDPLLANAGISVTPGPQTLAPGGTATFTATYTPTQAEIDAGRVENTATSTGTPPSGPPIESPPDTVVIPPDQAPGLRTDKTGVLNDLDGDGLLDAGETITYTFVVTNTGGVTMTDVTPNDPLLSNAGISVTPGPQTLAPRGSATFTATYAPTQAEIDAGRVENTATSTGTPPSGPPIESPPDTVIVPPDQATGLRTDKTGTLNDLDGDGLIDAGETITYTFVVTNTGAVTLTDVTPNDPLLTNAGISVTPGPQTLAPGANATFTATYTPTQAEIDAGRVENTATSTGTPPSGPPIESPPDTVVVPPDQTPGLTTDKTGRLNDSDGDGLLDPGETITYSFLVRNTGAVTLTNVTPNDPLLTNAGISVTPGPQTLAPGGSVTFTATYTPTQAEIDAGRVENTATSTGTPPSGPPIESPPDTVVVPPDQVPGLRTDKTGTLNDLDGDGLLDAGETITYSFVVTNTGAVTLTNVTPNDPLLQEAGISVTPGPQTLAPGANATFTATYTPTQAEVDTGRVVNTATSTGTPPSGPPTESPPDTVVVPPDQTSGLTTDKTGVLNDLDGDGLLDAGETISYTFVVRNTGAVTLTNVTPNDPLLTNAGISVTPGPQTLAPGGTATFTATYMPTQAEIDAGRVENTATSTGTPPSGPPIESPPDTVVVPPDQATGLRIEKTATLNDGDGDDLLDLGETITYSFLVTNSGAVTLTNVTPNDPLLARAGVSVDQGPQTLAPGASFTFTATYAPSQADIDTGRVENTATATGTNPGGDPIESPPDTVVTLPQPASLRLQKTGLFNDVDGNGHASLGDTLTYTFTITNDGGQTVTNVWPVDVGPTFNEKPAAGSLSRFTPEPVTLAPSQVQEFTATYTLTQQDIDNAAGASDGVANSATATGTAGGGEITSDESTSVITMPAAAPTDITVSKVANLRFIRRGEQAPFTIRVTNNTGARASGLTVIDTMPAGFRFVEDTATVDGVKVTPEIAGRQIRFPDVAVDGRSEIEIRLRLLALSTAGPGEHVNLAHAEDQSGRRITGQARAVVEIIVEPVFDCGDIVGKVFDDKNRNGYQDKGEPGLPGVRVATVKGWLITTDKYGRFHVACADLPDARIGTNFIMKLDTRTLPTGYRLTTENPRVVRLTAGKMTELNFGASIGRVVRLDLADEAFVPGEVELDERWAEGVGQLVDVLAQEQSVLRLTYLDTGSDPDLAEARVKRIKELIAERWRQRKRSYPLEIETRVEAGQ